MVKCTADLVRSQFTWDPWENQIKMFYLIFTVKMSLLLGCSGVVGSSESLLGRSRLRAASSHNLGVRDRAVDHGDHVQQFIILRCYRGCRCCGGATFLVHDVVVIPWRVADFQLESSRWVTREPGHVCHFYIMWRTTGKIRVLPEQAVYGFLSLKVWERCLNQTGATQFKVQLVERRSVFDGWSRSIPGTLQLGPVRSWDKLVWRWYIDPQRRPGVSTSRAVGVRSL